jgi:hypothetical protein
VAVKVSFSIRVGNLLCFHRSSDGGNLRPGKGDHMRRTAPLPVALVVFVLVVKVLSATRLPASNPIADGGTDRHAVMLELFTSEGCSSCPPADAFLKALDDAGHVNDVEIIAIEEHVDYWNRLGWTDPFSSHHWTERQQQYARSFRHDGVYTPQLVIDGRRQLVGSSSHEARQIIIDASKSPAAQLHFSVTDRSQKSANFTISVENSPPEAHSAELWLAVSERGLASNVLRGENEGRNLEHAAVLRSLTRIRPLPGSSTSKTTGTIPLDVSWKRENLRFVIFLQEPKTLHIFGAAASTLSP